MSGKTSINWKIENFSCFNNVVHTKRIRSTMLYLSYCKYMELYPRGISGLDEHLVVRFCDVQKDFSGGRLSFISSDGSILCKLQVKRVNNKNFIISPLGPKYEDVIAQIKKKDEDDDQLTLLFVPHCENIYEQRMCTHIDVLKISLEIGKISFETAKSDKSNNCFEIIYLSRIVGDGITLGINCEKEGIQLILESFKNDGNALLVETCLKLRSNNGTLGMYEENKHVFVSEEPWTFSNSLKFHEVMDVSNTLILCVKIVEGELQQRYNHVCKIASVTIVQNTNVCISEKQGLTSSSKQTGESLTKTTKDSIATSNQLQNSVSALAKELVCLYQDQDFSDLQLKCGSVSFPVHKNILSTRSPVFKRMLSNDMREAASGTVDIEDLDISTLARFLTFLYSGSVDDLEGESALKLYYAADKYQVPTLKKECDVLSLADQHQDDVLLSAARDFILNNLNEVSRSEEWMSFMKREPLLVAETMTHFTAKDFVTKK